MILDPCYSLVVNQSVTSALAAEALMAPVKRIIVDAAQALAATVAELRGPLSATIARRHRLVERSETTSLDLFASLGLQALKSAMAMGWTLESGWMMRRIWISARSSVRIRMGRTCMMLWIGMRVALGFRLGLRRIWMSARSSVRIRMGRTCMMLWIGMRVALGFRLGFHVDSSRKKSRPVIVYF